MRWQGATMKQKQKVQNRLELNKISLLLDDIHRDRQRRDKYL